MQSSVFDSIPDIQSTLVILAVASQASGEDDLSKLLRSGGSTTGRVVVNVIVNKGITGG